MTHPSTKKLKGKQPGVDAIPHPQNLRMALAFDHSPRFAMSVILIVAFSVALLTTKGLLMLGQDSLLVRYLLAALLGYLTFFGGVWSWIWLTPWSAHLRNQRHHRRESSGDAGVDPGIDLPDPGIGNIGGKSPDIAGQGGDFGGGGASGGWDAPMPEAPDVMEAAGDSLGNVVNVADIGGDEGGCLIVIAGVAIAFVAFVIFGATIAVVWNAPAILAEVVFEVIIGSSLIRNSRVLRRADWCMVLFQKTWGAFAFMIGLIILFCLSAANTAPQATTALEVLHQWAN